MKRILMLTLLVTLVVGMLLTGCTVAETGEEADKDSTTEESADDKSADDEAADDEAADDEAGEIIVGNMQDLSGNAAVWGNASKWGTDYIVNQINEAGGIDGKKIKLITYDIKGDVQESINAYKRLVQQDKAVVVLSPNFSSIGIPLAPIAEELGVPLIGQWMDERATTNEETGKPWSNMFLIQPACGPQARDIASYAFHELGLKKIAIIFDQSNAFTVSITLPFIDYIEEGGGEIVAQETFQASDNDFRAVLSKVLKENPDAIYNPNYANSAALITDQAREAGYDGPILMGNTIAQPYLSLVKPGTTNVYGNGLINPEEPRLKELREMYMDETGETEPPMNIFYGCDQVLVLEEAIKQAASLTPEDLRDALEGITDVQGYLGNITIDPSTHRPLAMALPIQKVNDGNYEYTERYTAEPPK